MRILPQGSHVLEKPVYNVYFSHQCQTCYNFKNFEQNNEILCKKIVYNFFMCLTLMPIRIGRIRIRQNDVDLTRSETGSKNFPKLSRVLLLQYICGIFHVRHYRYSQREWKKYRYRQCRIYSSHFLEMDNLFVDALCESDLTEYPCSTTVIHEDIQCFIHPTLPVLNFPQLTFTFCT